MMKAIYKTDKIFWIIGLRRSGTSILRELILQSPDVKEIEFEPHPLWFAVDMNHFARFQNLQFVQMTLHKFATKRASLHGAKFALNPGVKALEWVWLNKTFPNSKFIFIIRDLNSTYKSYLKEDKFSVRGAIPWSSYSSLAQSLNVDFGIFCKAHPERAIYVRFSELCNFADRTLEPVFELLGARHPRNLQQYIRSPRH